MLAPLRWILRSVNTLPKARRAKRTALDLVENLESRQLLTAVLSEGFEGSFPGNTGWVVNSSQGRHWDDNTLIAAHTGDWSGFGSESINDPLEDPLTYASNMNTTMTKVVDLSNYRNTTLSWYQWMNTESGFDELTVTVSRPGETVTSGPFSGNHQSWVAKSLNLPDSFDGAGSVTITFTFHSDDSNIGAVAGNKGVWVDDILLDGTQDNAVLPGEITPLSYDSLLVLNQKGDTTFVGQDISSATDNDTIAFGVQEVGDYTFTVNSTSPLDAEFRVYDKNGNAVSGRRDLTGAGGTETLTLSLNGSEVYYLVVGGWQATAGDYSVSITSPTAVDPAPISTPATTYVGQTSSQIDFHGDVDFFQVTAPVNATTLGLTITPSAALDTRVTVFDINGNRITTIDNGNTGGVDTGNIQVTPGTTYVLAMSAFDLSDLGTFTLKADFDPNLLPPKVASVKLHKNGNGKKVDSILVKFDQPVDGPSAQSLAANYVLVGPKGTIVTGFTKATYSPNSNTVVLTLNKLIPIKKLASYKVQVLGTGTIHNASNQFFDGNADGVAGGDYQLQLNQAGFA